MLIVCQSSYLLPPQASKGSCVSKSRENTLPIYRTADSSRPTYIFHSHHASWFFEEKKYLKMLCSIEEKLTSFLLIFRFSSQNAQGRLQKLIGSLAIKSDKMHSWPSAKGNFMVKCKQATLIKAMTTSPINTFTVFRKSKNSRKTTPKYWKPIRHIICRCFFSSPFFCLFLSVPIFQLLKI